MYTTLDQEMEVGILYSFKAELSLKHAIESTVTIRGKQVKVLNQCYISDGTATVEVTIWEEWIDYFKDQSKSGKKFFSFHNLLVKQFGTNKTLQTCSDTFTEVLETPLLDVAFDIDDEDKEQELVIKEFDVVKHVKYHMLCGSCSKKLKATNTVLIKCETCGSTCRTQNLKKFVTVVVQCKELGDDAYNLDATMLHSGNIFEDDKDVIVSNIMELSNIHVKSNKVLKTLTLQNKISVELTPPTSSVKSTPLASVKSATATSVKSTTATSVMSTTATSVMSTTVTSVMSTTASVMSTTATSVMSTATSVMLTTETSKAFPVKSNPINSKAGTSKRSKK